MTIGELYDKFKEIDKEDKNLWEAKRYLLTYKIFQSGLTRELNQEIHSTVEDRCKAMEENINKLRSEEL